ncbi:Succinate-semialdehyde dehydrogenase [Salinisphaera sp. PC39]|uniref:NAD-dependent succinate-semialdehyde dehydrogenase n=1 Tax=Salinisphaera sp. PC39 TaxID=1304156 RepID=UPI003342E212
MNETNLVDRLLRSLPQGDADGGKTFPVHNPADGGLIAHVPDMSRADATRAIERAQAGLPAWSALTAKERAKRLRAWYDAIVAHQEELAQLLTREQGKPLAESRGEILYGASFVEWFAEEGKRAYGDIIPSHGPDKRILVLKQPIGVVGAITPWNFPNAMITRKVAPALAAGCTVVIKPAEDTPLSALALGLLAADAGIPEDVLNIVTTTEAAGVGEELTGHPAVRKISFTGSTRVGKILMRQSADTVKKVSLELGGNAPFLVFDDADLDAAVAGAILSKFRNAGQTCVSTNRILVQSSIKDEFCARFGEAVANLKTGDGAVEGNNVGPLINEAALRKVKSLVEDAVSKGADVMAGGGAHRGASDDDRGNFFQPTVLTGVTGDMNVSREEIFGPVAPIHTFDTEEEAVRLANDTEYGLAAYVYAHDVGRVWRVSEALEYGMVAVNEGTISSEAAPFGGVKASGIGREGSKYGLDEFLEIKYICLGGIA